MSVTTEVKRMSVEEWRAKGMELAGGDKLKIAFVCPFCKKVSTTGDFKAAGIEPSRAATNCIGRFIGAKGSLNGTTEQPCDWAAYGLLGTLNGGVIVTLEDGKEINVFDYAE